MRVTSDTFYVSGGASLKQDPFILDTVQGYKLPFRKVPPDTEIEPTKFS